MKSRRSSWGGKVKGLVADAEKNHFLAQRAETLLQSLRLRFPGLPQTALDMNKIQYNKVLCPDNLLLSSKPDIIRPHTHTTLVIDAKYVLTHFFGIFTMNSLPPLFG